jgi:hypothetical protein
VEISTLNEILDFIESEHRVQSPILESGQRKVYLASKDKSADKFVLKVCPIHPSTMIEESLFFRCKRTALRTKKYRL